MRRPMKKIIAILPHGYDWFSAVEHALVFGLSAALAIRIVPAIFHAVSAAAARSQAAIGHRQASMGPFLKVFGQRR
jgi:hypothetical protein